jgi:ADP-ribosyl-[dinitrogen reductase] hydrolase
MTGNFIKDAIIGVAVGDALGVPVEFIARDKLLISPVTNMIGYGTHNQPPGTWSDDTSLTLCLAEMLCNGYSIKRLAGYFVNWREYGFYTAHGNVFDIGIATSASIQNIITGTPPLLAGGNDEQSNGNGSLMRILPLLFFIKDKPIEERFRYTSEVSSVTHRHIRSIISCFIYLEFARYVLEGNDKKDAYRLMQNGGE